MTQKALVGLFSLVTHHPEFKEILADCCCNEHTVEYGVGQKKQEKFIVGKADTIVHPGRKRSLRQSKSKSLQGGKVKPSSSLPGTVMVHLQNTALKERKIFVLLECSSYFKGLNNLCYSIKHLKCNVALFKLRFRCKTVHWFSILPCLPAMQRELTSHNIHLQRSLCLMCSAPTSGTG